jgi:hypothetical protein
MRAFLPVPNRRLRTRQAELYWREIQFTNEMIFEMIQSSIDDDFVSKHSREE